MVAETETLPASAADSTDLSDERVELPSTEAALEEGQEAAQETEGEKATTTGPLDWDDEELWTRRTELKRVDYDPAEWDTLTERLGRTEQSIRDHNAAQEHARSRARENRDRLNKLAAELPERLLARFDEEAQAAEEEARPVSKSLLKAAYMGEIDALAAEIEPIVHEPLRAGIASEINRIVTEHWSAQAAARVLEGLETKDVIGHIGALREIEREVGKLEAPSGKKVSQLEKQVADLKAENLKLDAQLKGRGSGASTNGREASGGGSTWHTKAEARTLHAQGKITTDEMRRIRSDPSIPDGY